VIAQAAGRSGDVLGEIPCPAMQSITGWVERPLALSRLLSPESGLDENA
jgi:hypothetical protein